ncbi:MAG: hypothetical protein ACQESF_01875 [Nanobdellota archaeon]
MGEENQEILINYETVYELLRREKSRDEVQKLPDNFVEELSSHIKSLENEINKKRREIDSFSGTQIRKEEQKYYSMKRIINELYQKRERKIINMAITKSRTDAKPADVANLIDKEKELFTTLVKTLNAYRDSTIKELLGKKEKTKEKTETNKENYSNNNPEENNKQEYKEEPKNKMIRFLHPVPKFFDKEMNVLGPFETDEIANLPNEIVKILVEKNRAEEINNKN